jgi:catechol 2,3-dioxygenase-like lactoylglutathione lyase family enzyme
MSIVSVDVGLVSATDALVAFYVAAIGAEPLEPRVFPFATVHRLACGPVTLKVMVPADAPAPGPASEPFWATGGFRYLTLWVDDLDDVVARWTPAGGRVSMAPAEIRPGVRTAVVIDPDGNVVELMHQIA